MGSLHGPRIQPGRGRRKDRKPLETSGLGMDRPVNVSCKRVRRAPFSQFRPEPLHRGLTPLLADITIYGVSYGATREIRNSRVLYRCRTCRVDDRESGILLDLTQAKHR